VSRVITVSALIVGFMFGVVTWNVWAALVAAVAGGLAAALLMFLLRSGGN